MQLSSVSSSSCFAPLNKFSLEQLSSVHSAHDDEANFFASSSRQHVKAIHSSLYLNGYRDFECIGSLMTKQKYLCVHFLPLQAANMTNQKFCFVMMVTIYNHTPCNCPVLVPPVALQLLTNPARSSCP